MIIRKGYKFQLKTDSRVEQKLVKYAGSCRYVWNRVLAMQKERLDNGDKLLRYAGMCALLPEWKKIEETEWLSESPSHILQQSLRNLDRAFKDAFDKTSTKRFPTTKKRFVHDSFRFPDPKAFTVDSANGRIKLPKLGWVQYRKSREIEGTPKNVTVSRRGAHWHVSIQVELDIREPFHPSDSVVGIDMGVARFATLSDGSYFEPLNSFRKLETKLAREQRKLSRKVRFSSNWKKQKACIAKLHIKIADARRDYLHKASTAIVKNHGIVILEDLKVSNMSKSAKGTAEKHGKNVKAKSGLNKAILDQGWYEFRRQIEYKLDWAGGEFITVPPHNTSRTCPKCEHVSINNRKTQAHFSCEKCNLTGNADLIAAINILAAGRVVTACGESALAALGSRNQPERFFSGISVL